MSDAVPQSHDAEQVGEASPQRMPAQRGMFQDPVVRRMAYIVFGLMTLTLLMVLGALVSGVTAPTGPRTLAEKELAAPQSAVLAGSEDPAVWGSYITGLIGTRQYARAKRVIADGRASLSDSATAEFSLAEARLFTAQERHKEAIAAADKATRQIAASHKALIAAGGAAGTEARREGLPENYYAAVLLKAEALRALGQNEEAVVQYGVYITATDGAADILILRGDARAELGDKTGAEKDYRSALKFIPDSKEALQGLDKLGVER